MPTKQHKNLWECVGFADWFAGLNTSIRIYFVF